MLSRAYVAVSLAISLAACGSNATSGSTSFSGSTRATAYSSASLFTTLGKITKEQRAAAVKAYGAKTFSELRSETMQKLDNAPINIAGVDFFNMRDQMSAARESMDAVDAKYENLAAMWADKKIATDAAPTSEAVLKANMQEVASRINSLSLASNGGGCTAAQDSGGLISSLASNAMLFAGIITSFFYWPVGIPLIAGGAMGDLTTTLTSGTACAPAVNN